MTVVFYTHKGGVGKTTLGVHVAFRAMEKGKALTYVDADRQHNSMSWLSNHDWTGEDYSNETIRVTNDVPSGLSSSGMVLVDCPPAWDFATKLGKGDVWVLPVSGRFSIDGAVNVIQSVKQLGAGRVVLVANMVDPTTTFGREEINAAKALGVEVFKFAIPRHEIVRKAELMGLPVWKVPYGARTTATQNIQLFCDWVLGGCQDVGTYGAGVPQRASRYEV